MTSSDSNRIRAFFLLTSLNHCSISCCSSEPDTEKNNHTHITRYRKACKRLPAIVYVIKRTHYLTKIKPQHFGPQIILTKGTTCQYSLKGFLQQEKNQSDNPKAGASLKRKAGHRLQGRFCQSGLTTQQKVQFKYFCQPGNPATIMQSVKMLRFPASVRQW